MRDPLRNTKVPTIFTTTSFIPGESSPPTSLRPMERHALSSLLPTKNPWLRLQSPLPRHGAAPSFVVLQPRSHNAQPSTAIAARPTLLKPQRRAQEAEQKADQLREENVEEVDQSHRLCPRFGVSIPILSRRERTRAPFHSRAKSASGRPRRHFTCFNPQ